jgi:DNA topoisomerase IA
MDGKERRMYKLIWKTALESCMSPAIFQSIKATITSINNHNYLFIKHAEQMKFAGWMIIDMGVSEKIKSNPDFQFLLNQKAQQSRAVIIQRIYSKQVLKESKSHYTEAKLVQLLEKNGIGRPSTFSSLVDKIQERKYVLKQDISKRKISYNNIGGNEFIQKYGFKCPQGVRGRNSDNKLYKEYMGWEPSQPLRIGMERTYEWINKQVNK